MLCIRVVLQYFPHYAHSTAGICSKTIYSPPLLRSHNFSFIPCGKVFSRLSIGSACLSFNVKDPSRVTNERLIRFPETSVLSSIIVLMYSSFNHVARASVFTSSYQGSSHSLASALRDGGVKFANPRCTIHNLRVIICNSRKWTGVHINRHRNIVLY